jgi:NAD(P) transhydrogenase
MFEFDLVCIGSGPAGQRAAVQAAKVGKKVAVIEKRRCVGGVCLETGTIPSKTFREAVLSFHGGSGFDRGLGLSARKTTIEQLLGRVDLVINRESRVLEDQLARNDIELVRGEASFADDHTVTVQTDRGVRVLTTRNVLVAVGTKPAEPSNIKPDGEVILLSDDILNMKKLPRTMTVVGGGVIGIEYASMFAMLDIKVTLVDKRPRPLEFADHEVIDELIHQMRKRDVTFRCGEAVANMEVTANKQGAITLESGKRIVSDVILFSVGRVGATDTLNLDAVGLKADDRGRLTVNDKFQTSVEYIYAAGDVIGYPALAATSSEQGRLAACNMFGLEAKPMASHFPIGIYSIPEMSFVGANEEELTKQKVPYETGIARYSEIARGQILGDDTGMFKMIFHRDTGKLLGAHAIGTGATELIHVGQAVLALGGGIDYFLSTVFNYPTLAECYKVAAFDAANKINRERHSAMANAATEPPPRASAVPPTPASARY